MVGNSKHGENMKIIYKYPIVITQDQTVLVPRGAKFLSVMDQNGALCLWFEVETVNPVEARAIEVHGTGNPINDTCGKRIHIGSVIQGPCVWHVFERVSIVL